MFSVEFALKKIQDAIQNNFRAIGGGARFFSSATRKGESVELQADLNSNDRDRQKNAVKRIIATMTLGRDVSQLFTDVVKLGQVQNIELKKLVYLYILNTARLQPDKALLAVNTFLLDTTHSSPIVQGLALRTMLCLRTDTVLEYCMAPVRAALTSAEPYVRKTAALCVGKLFHQSPKSVEEQGYLPLLQALLLDPFPIAASNAAAVLAEMRAVGVTVSLTYPQTNALLHTLSDAGEWGRVYLLELLACYHPSAEEAEGMIEKVTPNLSHVNPAVALGAIKVACVWLERLPPSQRGPFLQRINTALVTLSRSDANVVFIVCRNVAMLLEAHPSLLSENIQSFFVRFTDPTHVKSEKLKLLLRVMTTSTAQAVAQELKEYTAEFDPVFTVQVIAAIATAAMRVEAIAPACVQLLLDVAKRREEFLGDVINAAKNIVRKYPQLFGQLCLPLLQASENVTEEDARVSLVWMVGEFCEQIPQGRAMIKKFVDGFASQEQAVQLAILTATVKVFLRHPTELEQALNVVLEKSSRIASSPDLRDRAVQYFRLLSKGSLGVDRLKAIVHGRKPPVEVVRTAALSMSRIEILQSINTVSAILAKPSRAFVPSYGVSIQSAHVDDDDDDDAPLPDVVPLPDSLQPNRSEDASSAQPQVAKAPNTSALDELFGPASAPLPGASQQKPLDLLAGIFDQPVQGSSSRPPVGYPAPPTLAPAGSSTLTELFGGPTTTGPTTNNSRTTVAHTDPWSAIGVSAAAVSATTTAPSSAASLDPFLAMMGGKPAAAGAVTTPNLPHVGDSILPDGGCIRWHAAFREMGSTIALEVQAVTTASSARIQTANVLFNRNPYALAPATSGPVTASQVCTGASVGAWTVPTAHSAAHMAPGRALIEVGIQLSDLAVIGASARFTVPMPAALQFDFPAEMAKVDFAQQWKGLPASLERTLALPPSLAQVVHDPTELGRRVRHVRGGVVHEMTVGPAPMQYVVFGTFKTRSGSTLFFEIKCCTDVSRSSCVVKASADIDAQLCLVDVAVRAMAEQQVT